MDSKVMKTFQEYLNEKEDYLREPGSLLQKKPSIKEWNKVAAYSYGINKRGAMCVDYIKNGEVVEVTPYILLDDKCLDVDGINDLVFKVSDGKYALPLGFGCLYQHKNQPNIDWNVDEANQTVVFTANRDIQPGEELFITYGKSYWKSRGESPKY